MNVDIENISSKKQPFWIPIDEVIENSYFEATKVFPTKQLDQCRNNPNEPQNIPNEIKLVLNKWLWNRGCIQKWLLSAKGSQMIKRKNIRPVNIISKYNQQDQDDGLILIMSG